MTLRRIYRPVQPACTVLAVLLSLVAGCKTQTLKDVRDELLKKRLYGRAAVEHLDTGRRGTIEDRYTVGFEKIIVVGFGVVVGLPGTGNMKALSRELRAEALKKLLKVRDPEFEGEEAHYLDKYQARKWMDSGYVSLVRVAAVMNVGKTIGDRMDVYVSAMDAASSLEGGYLFPTELRPYTHLLVEKDIGKVLERTYGRPFAEASGPVTVGPRELGGQTGNQRIGVVEAGGEVIATRASSTTGLVTSAGDYDELSIHLRKSDAREAEFVARLLNERFCGSGTTNRLISEVALAAQPFRVSGRIPNQYRADPVRFVEVIKRIPARLMSDREAKSLAAKTSRDLASVDVPTRVRASLVLEAIGAPRGVEALRAALAGKQPLARIEAGRALYFVGCDDALSVADELLLGTGPKERIEALALYTLFGRRAPLELMRTLLSAEDAKVAGAAAFALSLCGGLATGTEGSGAEAIDARLPAPSVEQRVVPFQVRRTYAVVRVPEAAVEGIVAVKMDEKRAIVFLGENVVGGSFVVDRPRLSVTSEKPDVIEISFKVEGGDSSFPCKADALYVGASLEFLGLGLEFLIFI